MNEDKRILGDAKWIQERADWLVSSMQGYAITQTPSLKEAIRQHLARLRSYLDSAEHYIFEEMAQQSDEEEGTEP